MAIHPNPSDLPRNKELAARVLDNVGSLNKIETERGWLGSFWGASSHIPHNVAASLVLILVVTGIVYSFMKINIPADDKSLSIKDFWGIITPIITLAIGYLFGEKAKTPSE